MLHKITAKQLCFTFTMRLVYICIFANVDKGVVKRIIRDTYHNARNTLKRKNTNSA